MQDTQDRGTLNFPQKKFEVLSNLAYLQASSYELIPIPTHSD